MSTLGRVAVLFSTVAMVAGCSAEDVPAASHATGAETSQIVKVGRRDIHSVVVVQATVVALPTYVTVAGQAGRFTTRARVGQRVDAGETVGQLNGRPVVAPSAGTVSTVGVETLVPAGMPLVSIRYAGFGISAPIPDSMKARLYGRRLGAKASLTYGASGFDCELVDAEPSSGATSPPVDGASGGTVDATALCLVPPRFRAYPGMPAHLGIDMGERTNVLALPVSAVSGGSQEGTVSLVRNNGVRQVQVQLGVNDGSYVEITRGLNLGDDVLVHAPLF